MNRLMLSIIYPGWRVWGADYIYFYHTDLEKIGEYGSRAIACILQISTDEIVEDFRDKL